MLFSGSLKYNIEYGLEERPLEKMEEVAKRINIHKFISEMENGYDSGRELLHLPHFVIMFASFIVS